MSRAVYVPLGPRGRLAFTPGADGLVLREQFMFAGEWLNSERFDPVFIPFDGVAAMRDGLDELLGAAAEAPQEPAGERTEWDAKVAAFRAGLAATPERSAVQPTRPPRYDAVFAAGVAALDDEEPAGERTER